MDSRVTDKILELGKQQAKDLLHAEEISLLLTKYTENPDETPEKLDQEISRLEQEQSDIKKTLEFISEFDHLNSRILSLSSRASPDEKQELPSLSELKKILIEPELNELKTISDTLQKNISDWFALSPAPSQMTSALTILLNRLNPNPGKAFEEKLTHECSQLETLAEEKLFREIQLKLTNCLHTAPDADANIPWLYKNTVDEWLILPSDGLSAEHQSLLTTQKNRIEKLKTLRKPLLAMYDQGSALIKASKTADRADIKKCGEAFQKIAVKLMNHTNDYIKNPDITDNDFSLRIHTTLSKDPHMQDVRRFNLWKPIVANILIALTGIGFAIQIGLYLHSGTILFYDPKKEEAAKTVKEIHRLVPPAAG